MENRREFLTGVATVGTITIAGCAGDDEETTVEGENGGNGGGEGLVIEEHELVEDDFSVQIEGILLNDTGEEQSYIEIRSTVYDEDGVRIDDFFTNTTDVPDGERWRFEVAVLEDAEDVADYELEASTSPF